MFNESVLAMNEKMKLNSKTVVNILVTKAPSTGEGRQMKFEDSFLVRVGVIVDSSLWKFHDKWVEIQKHRNRSFHDVFKVAAFGASGLKPFNFTNFRKKRNNKQHGLLNHFASGSLEHHPNEVSFENFLSSSWSHDGFLRVQVK